MVHKGGIGPLAHLVERLLCKQEASGPSPLGSTTTLKLRSASSMLKEFFIKKMLKAKGVPAGEVDAMLTLINKDPALFQQIAQEVQAKLTKGGDQMAVTMEVMKKHEARLKELMNK